MQKEKSKEEKGRTCEQQQVTCSSSIDYCITLHYSFVRYRFVAVVVVCSMLNECYNKWKIFSINLMFHFVVPVAIEQQIERKRENFFF